MMAIPTLNLNGAPLTFSLLAKIATMLEEYGSLHIVNCQRAMPGDGAMLVGMALEKASNV